MSNSSPYYLRCTIEPLMSPDERVAAFNIAGKGWDTAQSAWMCWREDGVLAHDLPDEIAPYKGYASIMSWGENPNGGWVRYWFAHGGESMCGLDVQALREAVIVRGEAPHEQQAAIAAAVASPTKHFTRCVRCDAHICLIPDCGKHTHGRKVAEAGGWKCPSC